MKTTKLESLGSRPERRARRGAVLSAALCWLAACTPLRVETPVPAVKMPVPATIEHASFVETGLASWYGHQHRNRRMADGAAFDMQAMTAAHRSLAFGTIVRVTNLKNGRAIKVRIEDRGPFVAGRIIDLSHNAAEVLGIARQGVGEVRVEVFASDQRPS